MGKHQRLWSYGLTAPYKSDYYYYYYYYITKRSSSSMEKAITCNLQAWGKRTSLWTSASLKPAVFRANTRHNRLLAKSSTVYRGKHVVSRHLNFRRSHLKRNKVSKSEGTRKVKYAYHFWNCADAVDRKLSKLTHACRSYSLPKLALFWDTVYVYNQWG